MESKLDWEPSGHPPGSLLMAALDSELSSQEGAAVEQHVAECRECSAQWQRLTKVSGRLTEFHGVMSEVSSLPEFELRLPPDKSRVPAFGAWFEWLRRPQFLVPAAALAVTLVGLALWTNSKISRPTISSSAPVATRPAASDIRPQPPPATVETQTVPQTRKAAVRPKRHARDTEQSLEAKGPLRSPVAGTNSSPSQTAEVFWALPYSDPALREEGAEIVRADLPREAFLKAGVPLANIPATGPRGRIAADILLGADGLPRAIRPANLQISETAIPTPL
jgi:Putative zinc-finger